MSRSEMNQQSIDRLQQAVESLEQFVASGGEMSADAVASAVNSEEVDALRQENRELKVRQEKAKKRLDTVIRNFKRHMEDV